LTFSHIFVIYEAQLIPFPENMKQHTQSLLAEGAVKKGKQNVREQLFERQGKIVYQLTDKPDVFVVEFISNGGNGQVKPTSTPDLNTLRNEISSYLFEYVDGFHIPTHFVTKAAPREMMVRRTEIVPISVRVYNSGNGVLSKRFGVKENGSLEFPIIEHYYQNGLRTGAWVNEFHVYALGIATPEEFKQINRIASKVNAVLRGLCDRRQLAVTELQLEFGRAKGQILLCDELSPLTCQFIDLTIDDRAKRNRFCVDGENAVANITELYHRLILKV
jgi:phosphoribosylaminoimidazole-succinocarboxamide synthase